MNFKIVARKIGFTENELKAALFLVIAAIFGLFLKFFDYETNGNKVFDYARQDSLFNGYAAPVEKIEKSDTKKIVGKKKETFNKSKLNIKFVNRQNSININTASVKELTSLPGIGNKTAEAIVEFRTRNGKFLKKEDLLNVKGIGKKKFLKIKSLIKVN